MTHTPSRKAPCSHGENARAGRFDRPFVSKSPFSDEKWSAIDAENFYLHGIRRLSVAIINHAVRDLLENGRHSHGAERWLLSREFDRIHNLLG
jgi:hypothetical protein